MRPFTDWDTADLRRDKVLYEGIPLASYKLTRLVSPKAKEMIAELRRIVSGEHPEDNWGNASRWGLLADILDEMNE